MNSTPLFAAAASSRWLAVLCLLGLACEAESPPVTAPADSAVAETAADVPTVEIADSAAAEVADTQLVADVQPDLVPEVTVVDVDTMDSADAPADTSPVAPTCTNSCPKSDASQCLIGANGESGVVTCLPGGTGCLQWSQPVACPANSACEAGACQKSCPVGGCAVLGARKCGIGPEVLVCADGDGDGCPTWTADKPCGGGLVCQSGLCALVCPAGCPYLGASQCAGKDTQLCLDTDGDGCPTWGASTPCPAGSTCANGKCQLPCTDTCGPKGATECGPTGGVKLCGDADGDGCLAWNAPLACVLTEMCASGACVPKPPAVKLAVNELALWPNPAANAPVEVFVELAGPANTDLAGWTLTWVGPAGEATVTLAGKLTATGFFVVAHPKATAATLAKAQQQSAAIQPPAGTYAVLLRFGKTLVDAVAWGVGAVGGEGSAAAVPGQIQSLGRDAKSLDSGDNSKDFALFKAPTPGSANVIANGVPKAVLACPLFGPTGAALAFDATGTVDPESQWATISLDFGDGDKKDLGTDLLASHTYKAAGNFVATLVATDGAAQSATASCDVHVAQPGAPSVALLRPASGLQVVAGAKLPVVIQAQAAPGRALTKLELRVADLPSDETPAGSGPWQTTLTVPAAPSGSWLRVEARAVDDFGAVGLTVPILLKVQDDAPVARFVGRPLAPTLALLDARGSSDTETASAELAYRWDFNADGNWDTGWAPQNRVLEKPFAAAGKYQVKLEVKDAAGQVSVLQRELVLGLPTAVQGVIQTATWSGPMRLTGPTTVAAGQTLTIAAGTTIQVDAVDSDGDGVGDVALDVQGKLVVQGAAGTPVVFAPLSGEATSATWAGLKLVGKGSTVLFAEISGAKIGVEITQDAVLTDVVVQASGVGLLATAGSKAVATRLTVLWPWQHGLSVATGGGLTAAFPLVYGAGGHGARVQGSAALSDGVLRGSQGAGAVFSGLAGGSLARMILVANQWEGVRLEPGPNGSPTVTLQRNTVVGNALTGARELPTVGTEATTLAADVTTSVSASWPAPAGLYAVQVAFTEMDVAKVVDARLRDGLTGSVLVEWKTPFSGWVVLPVGVSAIVAEVSDNGSLAFGKLQVLRAVVDVPGSRREASIANLVAIDARYGWWGRFPDALSTVAAAPGGVNVQGFACQPYDKVWVRAANCVGADTLPAGATGWGGSLMVTGDVAVNAGQTLTLVPGTRLWFAPLDANSDKIGDLGVTTTAGTVKAQVTPERKVALQGLAPAVGSWRGVRVTGLSTLELVGVLVAGARTGVLLEGGKATLTNVNVSDSGEDGVLVKAATAFTAQGLMVGTSGRDGVRIEAGAGLNLFQVGTTDNGNDGLAFAGPTAVTATVDDLVATGNVRAGLWVGIGAPQVSHALLAKNGWGARLHGGAGGAIVDSVLTQNLHEGVLALLASATSAPTTALHGNNLSGNCVAGCGELHGGWPQVKTDAGFKGNKLSAELSATPATPFLVAVVSYSELDVATFVSAQLRTGTAKGPVVWSSGAEVQLTAVFLGATPPTALVGEVVDTSSNYHGTLAVVGAFGAGKATGKQAAVFHNSAPLAWKGNWWGGVPAGEALTANKPTVADVGDPLAQPPAGAGPKKP